MIYLIGSLRNPAVPTLANTLRAEGHEVFDNWYAPGPETDDYWQAYEKQRGHTFRQALNSPHAWNIFRFDKLHLDKSSAAVLVLPAGKSAHLELGYCVGTGKRSYILMDGEPERYDVMYRFATDVCTSTDQLLANISDLKGGLVGV